jgi:hypothetical protein
MKKDTINQPINAIAIDPKSSSFIAKINNQTIVVIFVKNIGINLSAILILKLSTTEFHCLS